MELKENNLVIFKNDKKTEQKHPDYKGEVNVSGEIMDIALWVKEGKLGKYFSGMISKKREVRWEKAPKEDKPVSDQDLPF